MMAKSSHAVAAQAGYDVDTAVITEPLPPLTAPQAVVADGREFVRFSRLHRTLHACMIVSFLTLAVTGLSLKFSYTAWAFRLARVLGGFETAGLHPPDSRARYVRHFYYPLGDTCPR